MPGRVRVGCRLLARFAGMGALLVGTGGCVGMHRVRLAPGEVPQLVGAAVRDNRTPMDPALACFAGVLGTRHRPPVIAVGDVRDYTGKFAVNEGNAVTQGGALMVSSALGKLGRGVVMAERFDPTIAERELAYTDHRQLGDGAVHDVAGAPGGKVAWLPYYGGSIAASDYYIVGGITELNYDIRSGGFEAQVNQLGPKARTYTQSVAVDLRIVDTRSLLVIKTVSLAKQFTGYEVGFGLFQFFGSNLFDVNLGAKGQEPLQLGVRTALEEATMRLVGTVAHVDPSPCLALQSLAAGASPAPVSGAVPATPRRGAALNAAVPGTPAGAGTAVLRFADGSATLPPEAAALITHIVAARPRQAAGLALLARDSAPADPGQREAMTDRRIAAVAAALAGLGAAEVAVRVVWRPAAGDSAVHRSEPGFHMIARLSLG